MGYFSVGSQKGWNAMSSWNVVSWRASQSSQDEFTSPFCFFTLPCPAACSRNPRVKAYFETLDLAVHEGESPCFIMLLCLVALLTGIRFRHPEVLWVVLVLCCFYMALKIITSEWLTCQTKTATPRACPQLMGTTTAASSSSRSRGMTPYIITTHHTTHPRATVCGPHSLAKAWFKSHSCQWQQLYDWSVKLVRALSMARRLVGAHPD